MIVDALRELVRLKDLKTNAEKISTLGNYESTHRRGLMLDEYSTKKVEAWESARRALTEYDRHGTRDRLALKLRDIAAGMNAVANQATLRDAAEVCERASALFERDRIASNHLSYVGAHLRRLGFYLKLQPDKLIDEADIIDEAVKQLSISSAEKKIIIDACTRKAAQMILATAALGLAVGVAIGSFVVI